MLAGCALVVSGLPLPAFLTGALKHLGAMTTPLSLLLLGITFAGVELAALRPTRDRALLARHVDADHRYAAVLVTATNLASLAGLPLFLALFTALFPG